MEIVLLLIIIALLFYFKSDLNARLDQINNKTNELARRLEALKKPETESHVAPPVDVSPKTAAPKPDIVANTPAVATRTDIPKPATPVVKVYESQQSRPSYISPAPRPYVPQKSWWTDFKEKNPDLEKFIGENLINKLGILILVLGISYFVKFAIDKNWINETARTGIGILCGALVMTVAHKLRVKYAAFSSVLVAGAVSIFYFTVAIAFHDYHLFNQTVAFVLMTIITAFSALISLAYDRKELAILSLLAGFAVPFMVSTGEGNYIVLFTYITILNVGILTLAYYRKWNIVTLLAYLLTVCLYGGWLVQTIFTATPPYGGAMGFAFVFYFIFILIVIINNIRTKGQFTKIELGVLASNNFLFYAAGMIILNNYHPELKGAFTAVLAVLNLMYAWFLFKKFGADKKAVFLLIGLTLTFITLAIPVQFEGNYITLFWAAEAVLLMWLAQKSKFESYRLGSVIVHCLAITSLILDWVVLYNGDKTYSILANPVFITGLFTVASFVAVYRLLIPGNQPARMLGINFDPVAYRKLLLLTAVVLGYGTGILEVAYQSLRLIPQSVSANSVIVLFHLLYCAAVASFLSRSTAGNIRISSLIAAVNIALFAFIFSAAAFQEHTNYVETGSYQRTAFYLHYFSLAIIIYFGFLLYRNRAATEQLFTHPIFNWIAAFLIVYIASSELLLHGLVLSNTPVTMADIQSSPNYSPSNKLYTGKFLAEQRIDTVSNQIVKSGFPVLWGILAFVFLLTGIKIQSKILRIIALTLLGLTIVKLFLYDIRNVSETGKIIAFILLGVLILIISFVYQKIKVLVLDDSKAAKDDTN